MRFAGQIVEWNDKRGFGFVVTNGSQARIFFHISALADRRRRPTVGDRVTYQTSQDGRGRWQAQKVRWQRNPTLARTPRHGLPRMQLGAAALALIVLAAVVGLLPRLTAAVYPIASALSFLAYRADKNAARRGAWRIPEQTLHLIDLVGGWPGGLMAQQRYHHKTIKQPFQTLFWLSVVANLGALVWLQQSGALALPMV